MYYKVFFLFTILLALKATSLAQKSQDRLLLSIACNETDLKKNRVTFIIEFINNDTGTVILPDRIVPGPIKNIQVNLGFELLRVYNGDTIDVLKTHNEDINPVGLPSNNDFLLEPDGKRLVKVELDNFYFDQRGTYMIRFGLKKINYFQENLKFHNDIFSSWKIINNN